MILINYFSITNHKIGIGGRDQFHDHSLLQLQNNRTSKYNLVVGLFSANSWGTDPSGEACVGCGPQEEFYGCSDIRIVDDVINGTAGTTKTEKHVTTTEAQTTTGHVTEAATSTNHVTETSTSANLVTDAVTTENAVFSGTTKSTANSRMFEAVGIWKTSSTMDDWCNTNCAAPYYNCPKGYCRRVGEKEGPLCKAIGAWSGQHAMDTWCQTNCALNNCPLSHCACSEE